MWEWVSSSQSGKFFKFRFGCKRGLFSVVKKCVGHEGEVVGGKLLYEINGGLCIIQFKRTLLNFIAQNV